MSINIRGGVTSVSTTLTTVASSATSVLILVGNAYRKGATVQNDSTQVLYLKLSPGTASTTSYTVKMAAASYYELPYGYVGEINGIWTAANGNAFVTEFV